MATLIVPADGSGGVSNYTFNDTLQLGPGVDLNAISIRFTVDGNSTVQSLMIGYAVEVDVGLLSSATLTGTANITGPTDLAGGLPAQLYLENLAVLDINGTISTYVTSDGTINVSSGEKLNLTGDLYSDGSILIATNGELDLNTKLATTTVGDITVNGVLKSATNQASLQTTTNNGTIDITAGMLVIAGGYSITGAGSIIAETGTTLDTQGASAVSGTIVLNAGSTWKLSSTTNFTGSLINPSTSARIDLVDTQASSASVSNGKIAIVTSTGTVYLNETGLAQGTMLSVTPDAGGGSVIALGVASTPTPTPTPSPTPSPIPTPTPTPTPTGSGSSGTTASDPGVYRFFDKVHGTQFLTASSGESTSLQSSRPDLAYEGVGLYSVNAGDTNAAPVYRFFDKVFGTHFYTSSATEQANAVATRPDLTYEGVGFYEHTTKQAGDVAVYRYFEQTNGTHFYTSNAGEQSSIAATRPDLVNEGVAFYAPTS